ncbi:MAG: efflux RND transporter permease subunit [Lachnospiraceae bacterium]|nr:efflux RND transporter permease subunit [Lachnospiraceae bacterium]
MEKFSVKKPYTILVAVIMVLVLGIVSVMNMTTDLLPSISLPYLIVITTYPGASPERVESIVSEPMEAALGTVSGVKNVMSVSSENYSMTQLEFEDGTDMDSAMVKVSSAVTQVHSMLPEGVGTPNIMEISLDMIATMYVAVGYEGYDIYQLSDYVKNELSQYLEREEGVASVTGVGLVEKTIQVELDGHKIDRLNDKILAQTTEGLDEAGKQLDDALALVKEGEDALAKQQKTFGSQVAGGLTQQMEGPLQEVTDKTKVSIVDLILQIEELERQLEELRIKMEENEKRNQEYQRAFAEAGDYFRQGFQVIVKDIKTALDAVSAARAKLSSALEKVRSAINKVKNGASLTQEEWEEAVKILSEAVGDSEESLAQYREALKMLREALVKLIEQIQKLDPSELENPEDAQALIQSLQNLVGQLDGADTAVSEEVGHIIDIARQNLQDWREDYAQELQEAVDKAVEQYGKDGDVYAAIRTVLETDPFLKKLLEIYDTITDTSDTASGRIKSAVTEIAGIADIFRNISQNMDGSGSYLISAGVGRIAEVLPKIKAQLDEALKQIQDQTPTDAEIDQAIQEVKYQIALVYQKADDIPELTVPAGEAIAMLTQGQLDAAVGFSQGQIQLADAKAQLAQAQQQYDSIRSTALKSANLDSLLSASTLSQLIYAQNFAMPAGYIDDKDDNSWLLKVGNEYGSPQDIETALLADVEGIGVIRLTDVATITVIDNADDSYTKLNGHDAVVLAVFKGSTAGTNMVSRNVNAALKQLAEETPELNIVNLMDQGSYITMIVEDLLTSMALGALLAILVLALFLRSIRPTIMVGISIPLSVLFTMVLMYFTNLSLNIMTLSGLSLGIGMLVDNSIVVMENIMRMRQRGIPAARASVQGAKQVSNSIIASTLTTICVFLPMVFTNGTVRELLLPMALSITYCLTASLIVAMTVVPSSASVILRKVKEPKEGFFSRILDRYGKVLDWMLDHKLVPLSVAIVLLVLCIIRLIQMGIVLLPDMSGDNIQLTVDTHVPTDPIASYKKADEVMDRIYAVDGVRDVGMMDQSATLGLVSSAAGNASSTGIYIGYVTADGDLGMSDLNRLVADIQDAVSDLDSDVSVSTSMMGDLGSFMSSGLTVNVYGQDLERLGEIAGDVTHLVVDNGGFEHITAGSDAQEASLHLVIDKDKAMQYGLTVAQIYMQIAGKLTTEVSSTQVTVDGVNLNVVISDKTKTITRENLLDMEFTSSSSGGGMSSMMGSSSGMSSMSSMSGMMGGGMSSMMGGSGMSSMSGMMGGGADMSAMMSMMGGDSGSAEGGLEGLMSMMGAGEQEENSGDGSETGDGENADGSSAAGGSEVHKLSDFAWIEETTAPAAINRENMVRYVSVTADTKQGYNTTIQSRSLQTLLDDYNKKLDRGYSVEIGGETTQVQEMISQMSLLLLLALIFIYLVMVAQFQSILSPFIILFTVPLAFTGGMIGLILSGEQLSMLSLMGFLVLMGTVVNNGIVFVDYTNQLRVGGVDRRTALIATGKTRMRPILMTTLTTVLAMVQMIFGDGMGAQMGRGMAIVIVGGLVYSTLMTLFIIPVMYDILYKKPPLSVDVGNDLDDIPDDAGELIRQMQADKESDGPFDGYEEEPVPHRAGRPGKDHSSANPEEDGGVTFLDI